MRLSDSNSQEQKAGEQKREEPGKESGNRETQNKKTRKKETQKKETQNKKIRKKETGKKESGSGHKKSSRTDEERARANRNILRLAYLFCALFLCMAGYFAWFVQVKSQDVIGNSYNARLDRFSDRIVRGSILSSDGRVLAMTQVAADKTEKRYYPYDYLFVHSVGYSALNGKTGLESLANFYLLSSHVNLLERGFNELRGEKNLGDNVVTTLDLDLQQIASDALGNNRGAVVAMEPDTGKVLVMVSQPNFNANLVDEKWQELISPENTKAQLLNRAVQGLYPPGSTFKILTVLEYIKENPGAFGDYLFDCDGVYESGDYRIRCYHGEAHGRQTLAQAFANSCNGAFAEIGLSLDPASFHALAEQFLFNAGLPIALPYNKSAFNMTAGADDWEKLQTSIGQGTTQITPMHNLLITAAIANGGTLMKPYLVDHVENVGGQPVKKFLPASYGSLMTAQDAKFLADLMKGVVDVGTGSALRSAPYTAAGKTGSAEFETGKETHAWFVGYAPAEDPKIAVSVLVEQGGSGGKAAAPIARAVFDAYLAKQN